MKTVLNSRIAFYLATVLLMVAIGSTVIGKNYEATVVTSIAKTTRDHLDYTSASEERQDTLRMASAIHIVSLATLLLGVMCWGLAIYRREKYPRWLLVVLVILYLMLQCMMV